MVLAVRGAAEKAWFRSIQELYCWGANPSLALQTEALHSWTSRKPARPPVCSFSMACCVMEPDRVRGGGRWHRAGGHMEKPTWGFTISPLKPPLMCDLCPVVEYTDVCRLLTDSTLCLHVTHHYYYYMWACCVLTHHDHNWNILLCSLWKQHFWPLALKPAVRPLDQWLKRIEIDSKHGICNCTFERNEKSPDIPNMKRSE